MSAKKLHVLIGGGNGFVGRRLSRMLQDRGHNVTIISRQHGPGAITWQDVDRSGIPEGVDAVVNLAGENLMNPAKRWNEKFQSDLRKSRIFTNDSLVHAIKRANNPPEVFVSSSAIGYYEADKEKCYTEDSKSTGADFMSQLCRDWEASAQLPAAVNTRHATVRIGIALGREGGTIGNLILPFWFGLGGPISSGSQWFPWIHVDDVAGIFTHTVENQEVNGVLNAVAPAKNTNKEFAAAFGKALWRPAFLPLPGFVLKCVFGAERANVMIEGQQVFPKRTLEAGYAFIYPDIDSACEEFAHLLPHEYRE